MAKPNILIRSRKAKANELFNNNRLHEADALFASISQSTPTDAESWVMRGIIHRKLGLFNDAETYCRRALKLRPNHARGHQALGSALQCQGRFQDALASYRKAIMLQPDLAEAHYLLANALRETGAIRDAVSSYRQAIRLQPDFVEALSNLGATLTALGEIPDAVSVLNKAVTLRPNAPQILCNLGHILQRDGRFAEALEKYQLAMQLSPNSLDAISNVAALMEKTNRIDEATDIVNRELLRAPDDQALLVVGAKLARRANKPDEAIALLERALKQNPSIDTAGEIQLHLGQLYDRQGDTERAYAHLAEGNRLVAQVNRVGGEQNKYLERVERIHTYLTPQLSALPPASVQPPGEVAAPIFLLGFPRSGTTLLEQILDSHPGLQTLEEKPTVSAMVRAFEDMAQGRPEALAELAEEQLEQLRRNYFLEVGRHLELKPGNRLVDKMPLNTVNVHIIWRVFPKAKFILAIRHPCDVCLSCFMQNFLINEAMAGFFSLDSGAKVYVKVMQTWRDAVAALRLDYHRIRYEDLVADFEHETRALLNFLGVEWDDNVLKHTDHAIRRGTINTPSYHQVTQPIYQHAKYRWKRYAKQFEPVLPMLQPYIDYFGYTKPTDSGLD